MDLRSVQKPLKDGYRNDPESSRINLSANSSQADTPVSCSVDIGRAIYEAEAHAGVGGPGTAACSGDLLLGALAACAQVTCQMVAEAMGIQAERIEVTAEGDLDLQGTARYIERGPGRLRVHPHPLRHPGAGRHERAARGTAGEDRAVLRRVPDAPEHAGAKSGVGLERHYLCSSPSRRANSARSS